MIYNSKYYYYSHTYASMTDILSELHSDDIYNIHIPIGDIQQIPLNPVLTTRRHC